MQATRRLGLAARFGLVLDPDELEHRVGKEEAAIGGALPRVPVRTAFDETEIEQPLRFRRADRRADEHVIDFHPEAGHTVPRRPWQEIYGISTMLRTASAAPMMAPAATSLG